jgi:hypothetical protein
LKEDVEPRDELLMEITREMGLDRMGEKKKMEEMPLHHHLRRPLLPCLKRSMKRSLWRQSQSKKF